MKTKTVELIASPREPHFVGEGFRVHNFKPSGFRMNMQRISPFIMLDYNSTHKFLPSDKPKDIGVHPHKDLETVIIAYKDKVANHDNSQMCITQRIPRKGME